MKIQRNEPCPCGSGKKYKLCCLSAGTTAEDSPDQLTWRRTRRALEGYVPQMMHFVFDTYGPEAIHEAWNEFMLYDDAADEYDHETPHTQLFLPWFFHRWTPDPHDTSVEDESLFDHSPTSVYLLRRGPSLGPTQRSYLTSCAATPMSFHEVLSCRPGQGFVTRDILTGEEHSVLERSASTTLQANEILFAQIVRIDGIAMLEACPPFGLPPINRIQIVDLREKILRGAEHITPDLLLDYDIELRDVYLSVAEPLLNPVMPILQNTDGHELSPQQLVFDIDSIDLCFAALQSLAHEASTDELLQSAQRDRAGALKRVRFDWTKAGNAHNPGWTNTVLGAIDITRKRLSCEVNSSERAAELKGLIEQRLGTQARYRLTKMQSLKAAFERDVGGRSAEQAAAESADLQQNPAIQAELQRMMAAHYDSWPRIPLPALNGKTPEQAVQDSKGREKVEALLRQLEHDAPQSPLAVDPQIMIRLRTHLGLTAGPR